MYCLNLKKKKKKKEKKNDGTIKYIRNHFTLYKENEGIKEKIIKNIRKLFSIKNYDKKKKSSYLKYWDINNLCGSAMSQNLTVNDFKYIE